MPIETINLLNLELLDLELPLTLRLGTLASDAQFLRMSQEHHPCKVERNRYGEITIITPVGGIASTHEIFVASSLFQWAEAQGSGLAFGSNAGFNLPDTSCLSPDAAWVSSSRWEALTLEERSGFPPLCPEFIMEVRSRSDARGPLNDKMERWLENGAEPGLAAGPDGRRGCSVPCGGGSVEAGPPGIDAGERMRGGIRAVCGAALAGAFQGLEQISCWHKAVLWPWLSSRMSRLGSGKKATARQEQPQVLRLRCASLRMTCFRGYG